jgi:hypothetical protein
MIWVTGKMHWGQWSKMCLLHGKFWNVLELYKPRVREIFIQNVAEDQVRT